MHTFTKKSRPQLLKQISLRKSFYTNTQDNLVHAIQYLEEHPDIGHINHIILECFRTFYAPLGLLENSEPTEARRVALQSIAALEAHITFLREEFKMATPASTQVVLPPSTTMVQPPPTQVAPPPSTTMVQPKSPEEIESENNHTPKKVLSEKDNAIADIFSSFAVNT